MSKILTGRLKEIESTVSGITQDIRNASLVPIPSVGQSRSEKLPISEKKLRSPVMVPILNFDKMPLMPCHPARARRLIKDGKGKKKWFKGIMVVQLTEQIEDPKIQEVAVGVDPGSKREGFTVKSKSHVYLNVLSDAVTWVKKRLETRKMMRIHRRTKTPYKKNKFHRNINKKLLLPSIKARYQIKLNILKFLKKLYPIQEIVIEDVKAKSLKGKKRWNLNFSPIEVAKNWFYEQVKFLGNLTLKYGYDTYNHRNQLNLKKSLNKKLELFESHNVDSFCLADMLVPGKLDNKNIFRIIPLQFHRRQLHILQPSKNGIRKLYGGTISMGIKRGSIGIHNKLGIGYIGGSSKNSVALYDLKNGNRIAQWCKKEDITLLAHNNWKSKWEKN